LLVEIEPLDFPKTVRYVAGMDISASKYYKEKAFAGIVIIDYLTNKKIYENYIKVTLDQPYVPGFLAFREVEHLKALIDILKAESPEFIPDVILLDGNGILHTRRFGIACHLGVLVDIPTIGCAKTVFAVDGITVDNVTQLVKNLKIKNYVYLKGKTGDIWGAVFFIYNSTGSKDIK